MGDRANVYLTCRREDRSYFEEVGFEVDRENEDGENITIHMWAEEANYAASSELGAVHKKGIPFYGHHHEGGDYPARVFACNGKDYIDAEVGSNNIPVAEVNEDGEVSKDDLTHCRDYYRILKEARIAVGETDGNEGKKKD